MIKLSDINSNYRAFALSKWRKLRSFLNFDFHPTTQILAHAIEAVRSAKRLDDTQREHDEYMAEQAQNGVSGADLDYDDKLHGVDMAYRHHDVDSAMRKAQRELSKLPKNLLVKICMPAVVVVGLTGMCIENHWGHHAFQLSGTAMIMFAIVVLSDSHKVAESNRQELSKVLQEVVNNEELINFLKPVHDGIMLQSGQLYKHEIPVLVIGTFIAGFGGLFSFDGSFFTPL